RHLDMPARATEAVIEVEVAKGRVQVVAPQQADDAPAEPDAFRVAGRTVEGVLGFGKFIDFLRFLGAVLGAVLAVVLGTLFRRRRLLVGGRGVVVLRERGRNSGAGRGGNEPQGGANPAGKIEYAVRHNCLVRWTE